MTIFSALLAPAASAEWGIRLTDSGFAPDVITVDAGETLRFSSRSTGTWSVTSDSGLFDSGVLPAKGGFSMSLSVPGVHTFRSTGARAGTGTIVVHGRRLGGRDDDRAAERIPAIPFPPTTPEDIGVHHEFGVEASKSRIMVGFDPGATVAEANAALTDAGVRVIGGLPTLGILLVETRQRGWSGSFWTLDEALSSLRAAKGVAFAAMSPVVDASAVPRRTDSATEALLPGWDWADPHPKGNWGLRAAQFPEAWNLLETIRRKRPGIITGVVDTGFEPHPDLPGLRIQERLCPRGGGGCRTISNEPDPHGNHVAGIIGAAYDDDGPDARRSHGVSGGNPVAQIHGYSVAGFTGSQPDEVEGAAVVDQQLELFDLILRSRPPQLRVLNYSMGAANFDPVRWQERYGLESCGPGARDDDLPDLREPMKQVCSPNNHDGWMREMANVGRAAAPVVREAARQGVLIVQAAGNESASFCPGGSCVAIDAAARGEFSWVSRHWDDAGVGDPGLANPVLVVQSLQRDGTPRFDATLGGDIAAPGDDILSTVLGGKHGAMGGSSMAAAYVTALVGYLLADDPSLSVGAVRRRVLDWASARPSSGGPDFTWRMVDRLNRDVDGDGLVDYPTFNFEVEPPGYTVELDACGAGASGRTAGTYTWTVNRSVIGSTPDCVFRWRPEHEGTYSVTLTVTAVDGVQASQTKQVKVEDLLIVSVGDSIASGEGNPDLLSPAVWQEERCHRSAFAGPAQAARFLEGADERTSVTFVHLACSGARMDGDRDESGGTAAGFAGVGGLLSPYEGVTEDSDTSPCALSRRTDLSVCEPPQLLAARELVGGRNPDALLVSIGANDMWFSSILTECLKPHRDCSTSEDGRGLFEHRLFFLPLRYERVAARIKEYFPRLPPDRVILTQYPMLTTDETGAVNLRCGGALGISQDEARWAHDVVIPRLNAEVAEAAREHGWTIAPGIPEAFLRHGYCSTDPWIMDISGTFWDQGDKNGAFHPNYAGHSAYARALVPTLRERLGLDQLKPPGFLIDRAPRLNAFRPVAGGGRTTRVADVNDISRDGNRRVERTVQDDGAVAERPDVEFGRAPGELTAPDGRVDMRDLRRYRDAWLQRCLTKADGCPPADEIALDGDAQHPKRDLNFDGCVFGDPQGCGASEDAYARFDLNGDQRIDPLRPGLVPWTAEGDPASGRADAVLMSDLDVLTSGWTGGDGAEGWTKDRLGDLLRSADVEVQAEAVLDAGAAKARVEVREKDGPAVVPARTLRRRDGSAVLTVPLENTTDEFEVVTTTASANGGMTASSAPFRLKYGEDRLVAVCPDITVKAAPGSLPADGRSTSVVTATVNRCAGREVDGKDVTFTLEPSADGVSIQPLTPKTDPEGRAQAVFTAGTREAAYTVRVSADLGDGSDPLEGEVEIKTVPTITVRYLWRQTIEEWEETGSTRWQAFDPLRPDCTAPGMEYCIDRFRVGLQSQTLGGIQRAGTLVGGGDRFSLTERVSNSRATSLADWTLSFPDGATEDGGKEAEWWVTDPEAYTDHAVRGVRATDGPDGIRLDGLQAVGDLPYHYSLMGRSTGGTVDPIEGHAAHTGYLLVPQDPSRRIRFAAQPEEEVVFPRLEDGFKAFQSCGRLDQDLQTQPGYYVAGESEYIPGAVSVGRKPDYEQGDRPMPVGPGRLKVSYAFAAVVSYEGRPAPEPELPDCAVANPPDADFTFEPAEGTVAQEGRQVRFRDRSTDPDNDIVETRWEFGDGTTATGVAPQHLFEDDGTFTVKLTIKDARGNTDTTTREVVVENLAPEAEIEDVTAGVDRLEIRYRMLDPGSADRKQLRWRITSTNPSFPTAEGTDHAGVWRRGPYTGLPAGTYPLTLRVTDKDGASVEDDAVAVVAEDPPPPAPPPSTTATYVTCDSRVKVDREERDFLDLVNEYRERNRLAPVELSATLTRAADRHAEDMAAKDFMDHTGSDGSDPAKRARDAGYPRSAGIGENLAEGEAAAEVLWAWRASSTGHNENMLNPAWRAIGISRAKGGEWRWATSYGTVLDCPAAAPERSSGGGDAASARQTPTGDGVSTYAAEPPPVEDGEDAAGPPSTAPGADKGPAARSAGGEPGELRADPSAEEQVEQEEPLYPPTVAVAAEEDLARAGRPHAVVNRSRDSAGTPVPVELAFGDESAPVEVPADGRFEHRYPESRWWNVYELIATARDGVGRTARLDREVEVYPDDPPSLVIRHSDQIAVAGRPYALEVDVWDPITGEAVAGIELTFTHDGRVVTARTDENGLAAASVRLTDEEGRHGIEVAFAGNDHYKPATTERWLDVYVNHPPIAHAGGPYVIGEGSSLALSAIRSREEDPAWFDRITAYAWDLDADGEYDDAKGRLPRRIEGDRVQDVVCGGTCTAGQLYPVAVRVTDSYGDSSVATSTVRLVGDFDVLLGGETKTIVPGQSNSFAVSVIGSSSYRKPVTLSVVGLPEGVSGTFSRNPVTPTGVSVLKLTGDSDLETGSFPIRIVATDGEISKEIGDEVNVAFGLVPICRGAIGGVVTDKATGEPVAGVGVSTAGHSATTDASGRYLFEEVALGHNNAPYTHEVSARKDGYWPASGAGEATCGAVTEVDLALVDVEQGTVRGRVIDRETREPLTGARITELRCTWQCTDVEVARTGGDGRFEHHPDLGPDNEPRTWSGTASTPGYWDQGRHTRVAKDQPGNVEYELLKKCSGTLKGGRVVYQDTGLPAAGAGVGVYITRFWTPDVHVVTDADGRFEINRSVGLGYENSPVSFRAVPTPPPDAPAGTIGYEGSFVVNRCNEEATITLHLRSPKRNFGTVVGRVTDEESGAPLAGLWAELCDPNCRSAQTDADGRYRFTDVFVGTDSQTSAQRTVTVGATGYYAGAKSGTVNAGSTATIDVKLLKRRYGALSMRVVDSVTDVPLPGAHIYEGACVRFCVSTDRDGRVVRTELELADRNAPRGMSLTATADGYWPQTQVATLKADQTTSVEYRLQPECEPARVAGTVVNAETQEPIHGAQVSGGMDWPVFTDVNGRFVIERIKPSAGNNPRKVWLTASASGFYSQSKEITIFCGARITVEFGSRTTRTGTIVGTVTDAGSGGPLAGAFVSSEFGATTTTAADGTYRLTNVPLADLNGPREWIVHVSPSGYRARRQAVTVTKDAEARLDFAFSTDNQRPTAQAQLLELDEDTHREITVAGADADGDTLTYHVMRWPRHGRLVGRLPTVTYVPDGNFNGDDFFEFVTNDGVTSSERATVDLRVKPVNDPPIAREDHFDAEPDTPLRIPVGDLLANDVDADREPLQVTSVRSNHPEAKAVLEGDEVVFTPPPGWAKDVRYAFLRYDIADAAGATSSAWAYIRVNHGPASPRCVDRAFTIRQDQTLEGTLTCTDKNGDALTYSVVRAPDTGTLTLGGAGAFTYAPPPGFLGTTTFQYRARDGALDSDPATVTVTVRPANDPPACTDLAVEGDEDAPLEIQLACTDPDGDPLTLEASTAPVNGTLEPLGGGRYRFTPPQDWSGEDGFGFRARDGHGNAGSALVRIRIRPVNDLPFCRDLVLESAGGPAEIAPDCGDVDGDALTFEIAGQGEKGTASVSGAGLRYVPAAGASGDDAFTYAARDGSGLSPAARVRVTIRPSAAPNRPPVAAGDTLETDEDAVLTVPAARLLEGDTDPDGDALTVTSVAGAEHGTVVLAGDTVTFTPEPGYHGPARFTYTIADPSGATAVATVAVTVRSVNDLPVAADDEARTDQNRALVLGAGALLANDADPDGDPLGVIAVGAPANGTVELVGDTVTFTPAQDFTGVASFAYTAADPHGATDTATVFVLVGSVRGGEALLGCTGRPVLLEDVIPQNGLVRLLGRVAPGNAGRRVAIRLVPTGKVVAEPVVDPLGRFAATAPVPTRIRPRHRVRYTAQLGTDVSPELRLWRRTTVSRLRRTERGTIVITGRITGPLARRRRDRVIEIREGACTPGRVVARTEPRRDGRFSAELPRPAANTADVYRVRAFVPPSKRSKRLYPTYSLPRAVD